MGISFNPLSSVFDLGKTIIERVVPDKAAQSAAMAELQKLQLSGDLAALAAQTDINKIEATNPNIFISGWRPAVGWICALGLGIQFIIRPLFIWFSTLIGHPTPFPDMDMGTLMTLLVSMLGMSGYRTYEKVQGAAGNH